jgi:hypothetical protein
MTTTITQIGTQELFQRLNENPVTIIEDAYKNGQNVSSYLETLNPSENGTELDAFGRLMKEAGIVTRSNPQAGLWASRADTFLNGKATRALLSEFFARKWRQISFAGQRSVYLSGDNEPGSWERPYADAQQARWDFQLAPAIPLSELVGITTPIEGQDYRSFYLTYDADQLRKFRVGESAEIPIAKLADSERTIQLKKYGRGLQASYEQMRRMRVDKLALQIGVIAVQSEVDKVAAGLDILVNGDGNTGTSPTTHNLTTLDTAASAGTLTVKGYLAFKLKFAQPYVVTHALMQEAVALQLALLNVGTANVLLVGANLGGMTQALTPINMTADGLRYGWTADAPALQIVGFDRRFALEQVTEIGGVVDEMERFITNQTQILTMTEVHGFAIMDGNATRILDVNA